MRGYNPHNQPEKERQRLPICPRTALPKNHPFDARRKKDREPVVINPESGG